MPNQLDRIRFEIRRDSPEYLRPEFARERPRVHFWINEREFINWVRAVEAPMAAAEGHPDIAGSYAPFDLDAIDSWGSHLLPVVRRRGWPPAPWTSLFVCGGCGEEACWPLFVDIGVTADRVRWRAFMQPFRSGHNRAAVWDMSTLGPFEFDRAAYEAGVKTLDDARQKLSDPG